MTLPDTLLALCLGVGLAAACGFRVFVPLLVMSIALKAGHLQLSPGFAWIGSDVALALLVTATVLEIAAYYVPWLDNALDSVATPAAVVAGTVVTASMVSGMSPMLQWSLAIIAGGGAAAAVQSGTVVTRATSTLSTGGMTNFLVATAEAVGSVVLSVLAFVLPLLAAAAVVLFVALVVLIVIARRRRSAPVVIAATPTTHAA